MWQALAVTNDADLLEGLRDQLEAPGYAAVEAGNAFDAEHLLQTSGSCLIVLLAPLLSRLTSATHSTPVGKDPPLVCSLAYLLLAANPPALVSTTEPALVSPVIAVVGPERLEELLECLDHAATYLGENPAVLAAPRHPSQGNLLGESLE